MDLSKLNRRTFLQASAAAGLAAAVESSAAEGLVKTKAAPAARTIEGETKIVKTCCRACIHNCAVLAHVRNGRVVKLEGNPDYPMSHGAMCAKGLAGISALYHPNRNKYPLMRVGKRGENKWKRISWKEAIDTIAGKMEEVRREYGAESVLFSTGGGGNPAFRGIPRHSARCECLRHAELLRAGLRPVLPAAHPRLPHDVRRPDDVDRRRTGA